MCRLRIMAYSEHLGNYKETGGNRHDLCLLDTVACHVSGGPAELEGVAARRPTDVEHISREIEVLNFERTHGAGVHFGERHAAVGDDGAVEAHEPRYCERRAFQYMDELSALLFRHAMSFYILVRKREEFENSFWEAMRDHLGQYIFKILIFVGVHLCDYLPFEGGEVGIRVHINGRSNLGVLEQFRNGARAV